MVHSFFNITSWPFNNAIPFLALATCSKRLNTKAKLTKKYNMHNIIIVSISLLSGHSHPWKKDNYNFSPCSKKLTWMSPNPKPFFIHIFTSLVHVKVEVAFSHWIHNFVLFTSFWVTYVTLPLFKKLNLTSLINFVQNGIFQGLL